MQNRAQGAIEYLLIIGAAILVVAIVTGALMMIIQQGQTQGTEGTVKQDTAYSGIDQIKKDALGIVKQTITLNQGDSFVLTVTPITGTTLGTMLTGASGTVQVNGTSYTSDMWNTVELKKDDIIYAQTISPSSVQISYEGTPDKTTGATCKGSPSETCSDLSNANCALFSGCTLQTNNLFSCTGTIASTFCSARLTSTTCTPTNPICSYGATACTVNNSCSSLTSSCNPTLSTCTNCTAYGGYPTGCSWARINPTTYACQGTINPAYCTRYSSNQTACTSMPASRLCSWTPACRRSISTCSTMPWISSCSASNPTCANCTSYSGGTTGCTWSQTGSTQTCVTGSANPICAGQNETNCSILGCTWN
jgi:hypothetical protein